MTDFKSRMTPDEMMREPGNIRVGWIAAQICGRLDELIEVLKNRPTSGVKYEEPEP